MDPDDGMIRNQLYSGSSTSSFACETCKKKKIKCDKQAPRCGHCVRLDRVCDYPVAVPKPGPKRPRRRRSSSAEKQQRPDSKALQVSDNDSGSETGVERTIDIAHPHHDTLAPPPLETQGPSNEDAGGQFGKALSLLGINEDKFERIVSVYLKNMTSFSLFHQPSFKQKLHSSTPTNEIRALLLAMAAFTQNFEDPGIKCSASDASLWNASYRISRECLDTFENSETSLVVLQAFILLTWQKVWQGVRGLAFRLVGECVRMAYELHLNKEATGDAAPSNWMEAEERRRAWWACWELDVFASTIKQVPLAIEWSSNKTLLPMPDSSWFAGAAAKSCPLDIDPNERWKELQKTGNNNWNAWFIVFNSYKFESYLLSMSPSGASWRRHDLDKTGASPATSTTSYDMDNVEKRRQVLINCLHCAQMALPEELSVHDSYLSFTTDRVNDCGRYSIHLMKQLTKFMLYRLDIFRALPSGKTRRTGSESVDSSLNRTPGSSVSGTDSLTRRRRNVSAIAWEHFMASAEEASTLLRNCPPEHVRYVNPCLSNILWFCASALIIGRILGSRPENKQWMTSNFNLIWSTLKQYIRLWNVPASLVDRFDTLQDHVSQLGTGATGGGGSGGEAGSAADAGNPPATKRTKAAKPPAKTRPKFGSLDMSSNAQQSSSAAGESPPTLTSMTLTSPLSARADSVDMTHKHTPTSAHDSIDPLDGSPAVGYVAPPSSSDVQSLGVDSAFELESLRDANLNDLLNMSGDFDFDFDFFRCPFE